MNRIVTIATGMLCGLACLAAFSSAASGEQVDLLDAQRVDGKVAAVTGKAVVVSLPGGDRELPIGDVAEIRLADAADPMFVAGQAVLSFSGNDLAVVVDVGFAEGKLAFHMPAAGEMSVEVSQAAALYLPSSKMTADAVRKRLAEMRLEAGSSDVLVIVREKENWLSVEGVLKSLSDSQVVFRWKDQDRTFPRSQVAAVLFARLAGKASSRAGGLVLRDGSTLGFEALTMDAEAVRAKLAAGLGDAKIERKDVAAIRLASGRIVDMSALKPVAVSEHGVFKTYPHRVGASVSGGALKLGGKEYSSGLGLHSFCELTYSLDGQFATFVATVGIDDAARPGGQAVLTFIDADASVASPADSATTMPASAPAGQRLAEPMTLTGKGAPKQVRLNVKGVKRLIVRVDYGPDSLDVADHVDIVEPRLIR